MIGTVNFSHKVKIYNLDGEVKFSLPFKRIEDDKPVVEKLSYEKNNLSDLLITNLMIEFGEFDYSVFNKIHIKNSDLFGIMASDTEFLSCEVQDSIIYACTLYGAKFRECIFKNVLFRGVNLATTVFDNCIFNNCKFTSDHINHFTDLTDSYFIDCNVENTIFNNIDVNENTLLPLIGKKRYE